jgi:hypothetical protein
LIEVSDLLLHLSLLDGFDVTGFGYSTSAANR